MRFLQIAIKTNIIYVKYFRIKKWNFLNLKGRDGVVNGRLPDVALGGLVASVLST
jgi:hypothetical protein